jgi:hypothetical protein
MPIHYRTSVLRHSALAAAALLFAAACSPRKVAGRSDASVAQPPRPPGALG